MSDYTVVSSEGFVCLFTMVLVGGNNSNGSGEFGGYLFDSFIHLFIVKFAHRFLNTIIILVIHRFFIQFAIPFMVL